MKNKIITLTIITIVVLAAVFWNSSLLSEYRGVRLVEKRRTSAFEENSYENEKLIEIVEVEDIEFYIYEADEYNNNDYNSKVYFIVRCESNFLGFRQYDQFSFMYDGHYGISWSRGEYGTTLLGVKEVNTFNEVKIELEENEFITVDVTNTDIVFFFTTNFLDIVDIKPIDK